MAEQRMTTLLIIIHLIGSPILALGPGHPPDARQRAFMAFMAAGDAVETTSGFSMSEKPMPSMEVCEKFVARLPTDKGTLLYCVDVGLKSTFQ